MRIIHDPRQLSVLLRAERARGRSIGFVPTMGALHEGHASLIRRARGDNDIVVASIFVNPLQFGPKEDFGKYPRPVRQDLAVARRAGVDYVFCPSVQQMYPQASRTVVTVEGLGEQLCGASRPGHFRGVATVVAKLLNIVGPDKSYFGQKDAQQALIIKRMCADLNINGKIVVMPIVREPDGLAMSSRNRYLSAQERRDAVVLYESLGMAVEMVKRKERSAARIIRRMEDNIRSKKRARIDYAAIVDARTLEHVKRVTGKCLIALAVWIGKTRLIDNIVVKI